MTLHKPRGERWDGEFGVKEIRVLMLRELMGEGPKGRDLWEKRHIQGTFLSEILCVGDVNPHLHTPLPTPLPPLTPVL